MDVRSGCRAPGHRGQHTNGALQPEETSDAPHTLSNWVARGRGAAVGFRLRESPVPTSPAPEGQTAPETAPASRQSHQDWPTGHYRVVEDWPKPLPDTRHSHDGWTWGSFGGCTPRAPIGSGSPCAVSCRCRRAPSPGRRTPRSLRRSGNATGNGDGLSATCEPADKRGWERRFEHSILIVDGQGNLVGRVAASGRAVQASCRAAADRTRSRSARTTQRSTSGSSTTSST